MTFLHIFDLFKSACKSYFYFLILFTMLHVLAHVPLKEPQPSWVIWTMYIGGFVGCLEAMEK